MSPNAIMLTSHVRSHSSQAGSVSENRGQTVRVNDIPEIAQLSMPEKILLVEELWDSITVDEASVPIPQSHKEALDSRWQSYESAPGNLLSLEALQSRIESRK